MDRELNVTFDSACRCLEDILAGDTRPQIVELLSNARNFKEALLRLRDSMRSHVFQAGARQLSELERVVKAFDVRTVEDGFHVLRDWDGKAEKFNEDLIPVDVLNFYLTSPREGPPNRQILSIFLDYYLIYVLALFCLRAWDEGDPNDNLGRITRLIHDLHGPAGSGHYFVANAETLILIATSHFEPDEKAYDRLLAKVRRLTDERQVNIALSHAAILGSHLRHGFQDLYEKDLTRMRNDNGPDYPWLCFSVTTLMKAYARLHETGSTDVDRERIVEGILNGMTADARAFLGKTPAPLAEYETDLSECRRLFKTYKDALLKEFEAHRPSDRVYSPLAFNFNFPHNLVKAAIIDALLEAEGVKLTVNDLLTSFPRDDQSRRAKQKLASTLTKFAAFIPDRVKGRTVPVISYSPQTGLLVFAKTLTIIKNL